MIDRGDNLWGTDTPISEPRPREVVALVDFGGFAFGETGLIHNLTEEEREAVFTPHFAPQSGGEE